MSAFLATLAAAAASHAFLAVECSTRGGRPTSEHCATRLGIEDEGLSFDERFVLAFNDPIESFRYESRWKPLAAPDDKIAAFFRVPVLGQIRDRFIDGQPFNDTLLFTTNLVGAGAILQTDAVEAYADMSGVWVRQRFAPTLIHSDEQRDPSVEPLYSLSLPAILRQAGVELREYGMRLGAHTAITEMHYEGRYLTDREGEVYWRAPLVPLGAAHFGLSFQYYHRDYAFRLDGARAVFEIVRGGLLVEF